MTTANPPISPANSTGAAPIPSVTPTRFWKPLRATIYKEIRQNAIYLLIIIPAFVLLGALAGFLQYVYSGRGYFQYNNAPNILCLPFIQLPILFACPLIGLLLGSIQPRNEQQIDDWAFLVHRPVSRFTLFLGRAISALFLYAIAAGLPLVTVALFASSHSGGEFFHPSLLLAPAADFFTGILYYFIGLLMAEYEGWRFGPRKFPFLFGVVISFAVYNIYTFSHAMLVIAVATVIVVIACVGGTSSHGFSLRAPPPARLARTFLIFAGFTILLSLAAYGISVILNVYESREFQEIYNAPSARVRMTIRHTLLPDGHIGELVTDYFSFPLHPDSYFATLAGKRLDINVSAPLTDTMLSNAWERRNPYYAYHDPGSSLFTKGETTPQLSDGRLKHDTEDWYYVYLSHRIYIQDHDTHDPIGTFGLDGFAPAGHLAQPFDGPVFSIYPMITSHGVYAIDKEKRTLTALLTTPADDPILAYHSTDNPFSRTALITAKHLYLLDQDHPAKTIILPMPFSLNNPYLYLTVDPHNLHFAIWSGQNNPHYPQTNNMAVKTFDASGHQIDEQTVDWMYSEVPLRRDYEAQSLALFTRWSRIAGASYGFTTAATFVFGAITSPWWRFSAYTPFYIIPSYFAVTVLWAVLAIRLARARNRSALRWSLAALLFGPAVLLTLLAIHSRIPSPPCPTCQKSRPVTDEICPHCHAARVRISNGTEIFA